MSCPDQPAPPSSARGTRRPGRPPASLSYPGARINPRRPPWRRHNGAAWPHERSRLGPVGITSAGGMAPSLHLNLGDGYLRRGHLREAEAELEMVLQRQHALAVDGYGSIMRSGLDRLRSRLQEARRGKSLVVRSGNTIKPKCRLGDVAMEGASTVASLVQSSVHAFGAVSVVCGSGGCEGLTSWTPSRPWWLPSFWSPLGCRRSCAQWQQRVRLAGTRTVGGRGEGAPEGFAAFFLLQTLHGEGSGRGEFRRGGVLYLSARAERSGEVDTPVVYDTHALHADL